MPPKPRHPVDCRTTQPECDPTCQPTRKKMIGNGPGDFLKLGPTSLRLARMSIQANSVTWRPPKASFVVRASPLRSSGNSCLHLPADRQPTHHRGGLSNAARQCFGGVAKSHTIPPRTIPTSPRRGAIEPVSDPTGFASKRSLSEEGSSSSFSELFVRAGSSRIGSGT